MTGHRGARSPLAPRVGLLVAVLVVSATPIHAGTPQFEKDVAPILAAHCLKCHGADQPKAALDLRTRAGILKGGESGPALVPGSSAKSLVFEMVRKGEMPPRGDKPTAAQVAILKAWIDGGAPAADTATQTVGKPVTAKDRDFWAFRKPTRPPMPHVKNSDRVRTPIDAFILYRLEAKGLTLSPDADRATLLRRVFFDLIGLPPSPEEADAFLNDPRPDAYERLVDRLLASPHHGERWGRHWLDAAGYSDSIGGDNDPGQVFPREGMYRYRDYVVRALNDDKPYDRFLTEQLAGDEMDDWRSAPTLTPPMREHLIATGLLRTTVDHTFEDELNRPFERYQVLHDTIENLTSNLLGLTVACARCHDHKFDPISQVEYYQLLAVLKPICNPERWVKPQNRHLPDASPREMEAIERHNADVARKAAELNGQIAALGEADRARIAALRQEVNALNATKRTVGKIQAAWEATPNDIPTAHVFRRGNHLTPAAEVQPGFFAVLTDPHEPTLIPPATGAPSSGRRTAWARWLTRPDHPLTARVLVNRVWQHYFGEGIVATSDNFGHLGARPTLPELLDWLATEFVRDGWSMKKLHRLIVTSTAYRQSAQRLRRLESEAIRDAVLAVSGRLDRSVGGPPVPIEPRPDGMVVVADKGLPSPTAARRRSLYLFARRNYNLTVLNVFDQPAMATNCTRRVHSAVPLQSLTLLNDAFLLEHADHFAARVAAVSPEPEKRVTAAFRLAFARNPTPKETASALALLRKLRERYVEERLAPAQAEQAALARLCHMLLCANEFLYVG